MSDARPDTGSVLWFTGFSGAGKSTIATEVWRRLMNAGTACELLDGDAVRAISPTGFGKSDRQAHIRRVGFLASRLEHHGVTVLCALISPYIESRENARQLCRRFLEIHVSTPLAVCERRDAKGLYAAARRGEISDFTGLDSPYEAPMAPDLSIDTTELSIDAATDLVLRLWVERVGGRSDRAARVLATLGSGI
jgi:adenylylsulfate kinase